MKNLILFILLLVCVDGFFAQKISPRSMRKHRARVYESRIKGTVILSLDTIFNKGVPYAIFLEKKQLPYNDYALISLGSGNRLISIHSGLGVKDRTPYYAFDFQESKKTAEPEKYAGFDLVREIVRYQLVDGDKINPYREMDFLKKYPRQFSDPYYVRYVDEETVTTPNIYETIKRDRDKEAYIGAGKIQQDYKTVGLYKEEEDVVRFYLPSRITVAEASRKEPGSATWLITTLKDEKTWTVSTNETNVVKDLVQFLLDKQYL